MKKITLLVMAMLLCLSCFPLTACGPSANVYEVNLNVWYKKYGHTGGEGKYEENKTVTISAFPIKESSFVAWMKDNVIVSYEQNYSFKMNKETSGTYTAIFSCPEMDLVVLKELSSQSAYNAKLNITNLKYEIYFSNDSFNNSTLLDKQEIKAESGTKTNTEFLNKVALNINKQINATIKLTYNYLSEVDGEETNSTATETTYLTFTLTKENLETQEFDLLLPKTVDGSIKLKFSFEFLEKTESPDKNPDNNTNPDDSNTNTDNGNTNTDDDGWTDIY